MKIVIGSPNKNLIYFDLVRLIKPAAGTPQSDAPIFNRSTGKFVRFRVNVALSFALGLSLFPLWQWPL